VLILKVVSAGAGGRILGGVAHPPRLFLLKSAQVIENKRLKRRKKPQESSRVRKRMKAKKLRMLVDDGRQGDLGERIMSGENAEMGLGRVGGIGGIVGEKKMRWSESRAGGRLAITAYFTAGGGPAKLYEGTKTYTCTCARREPGNSCKNEVRR
jgi:hypothetical protein